ncbi:MAG: hypothetical protein ACYCV7_09725, partial [Acidimicrobiales bacterium]
QRLLAEGQISAGHARALLGTPDRAYQESLAKLVVSDGLSVRAVEDRIREHSGASHGEKRSTGEQKETAQPAADPTGPDDESVGSTGRMESGRLPPPGILELEELLANHLNTRVKVDLTTKRGKVVVEFATLEDLERIYKLMIGGE